MSDNSEFPTHQVIDEVLLAIALLIRRKGLSIHHFYLITGIDLNDDPQNTKYPVSVLRGILMGLDQAPH
jgi:hypothetical protein